MRMEIDSGSYVSACTQFYDVNHAVVDIMTTLVGALDGAGGMAGTDTGGESFADQYDPAAAQLVQAGCQLGDAMSSTANLLNASLVNHRAADHGAIVAGGPYSPGDGDSNPDHYTSSLSTPTPPSARGGTGDQPGWWHWIASHVEGLLWPDADTGKLRSTGQAWTTAGNALTGQSSAVSAAGATLSTQRSPEIPDAVAACRELGTHVDSLAQAFLAVGQACNGYADAVDQHHQEVEDELKSFIEWTVAIEAGGAILGALTFGIGEAAAQAAEAGEVANAAQKVIRILNDLIELARLGAAKIGELVSKVGEVLARLKVFLNARVVKVLEAAGVRAARVDLESLPAWATKEGAIPSVGPDAKLYEGFAEGDRYGGLTKQEFYDKYWDAEKGSWKYPPDDGFAGPATANDLKAGQTIDRLGPNSGNFASPAGDGYGSRALPPSNIGRDYHQFKVLKPLPDTVTQGKIAPWFEQPGGGTQYFFDKPIQWYIDHHYLAPVP